MKKSYLTQELVNIYPPWARVRQDQSIGYQILNVAAQPMEHMEKSLQRMQANQFLASVNLDEVDLTYRAILPTDFNFDTDNLDPTQIVPITPTVSGLIDSTWYTVELAADNDLESFWYTSIPNRASLRDIVSGDHNLANLTSNDITVTGIWDHHLGGGALWIEAVGGTTYIHNENNKLKRGRVILRGKNRQGQEDTETLIFPWDMKQKTFKEWKTINKVESYDIEDDVDIFVTSANFNSDDYMSPWNLRYSEQRNKIDEFWSLGNLGVGSTLDHVEYVSDEWQQLIVGFIQKDSTERWELLDSNEETVSGVDMALQPFSDRAWIITEDSALYCYDASSSMISNLDLIKDRTAGSNVLIDVQYLMLLGENIEFTPWHARPVKEILKYRLWYQTPSGVKYGLLDGTPVAFATDFWVVGEQLKRNIGSDVTLSADERGEYLLVLEAVFIDGESHTDKTLVAVNYKIPTTEIDLSSILNESPIGIDFDSDQHLWIRTAEKYYQIALHTDIMLIDYQQKIIYFKEPYDEVDIETDG